MISENNKKMHDKIGEDIASKMSVLELASQLKHTAKRISRLNVKEYNWWNESLHGVARAGIATVFPQAIAMASTFSDEIIFEVASTISDEARAKFNYSQSINDYGIYKGLTMWSPNINIYRDPRWGRGHETYGEDPYLTGALGVAFIKGLQGNNEKYIKTSACAKHFAVHSGPESERHTFNARGSKKDLFETYLPAFERAVRDANVSGVMGAYNRANDEPCCASPTLINKLLRNYWGFDGYFVSDCGALLDIVYKHKLAKSPAIGAAMALNAGCDLECGALYNILPVSYAKGLVDKDTLKKSVSRLMSIRSSLGMFDEKCPFNKINPLNAASIKNESFAIEVAEKSVVLLENNGILPLKENNQKILVTGYNSENELAYLGNYNGEPSSYIKMFSAIKERNKATEYSQGIHLFNEEKSPNRDEAIEIAKSSDLIIMCTGLDPSIEGEESGGMLQGGGGSIGKQGDRITLEMPKVQQDLLEDFIALGKKIIILNFSGGCISFRKYKGRVDAILQCWYPGAKGGKAIANILFGDSSPSGKLPVTFYHDINDIPDFEDYEMKNRTYKYFKGDVEYPFGYGLTYTKFELKSINLDEKSLSLECEIQNSGKYDSDEVLELFISYPKTEYQNPIKSLIKAKRVHIKHNESEKFVLNLCESDFYSIDDCGNKVFLKGEFTLCLCDGQSIKSEPITFVNKEETKIIEICPI